MKSQFLIDTCGWIEWLTNGVLVDKFTPYFKDASNIIVPTVLQYELYKWVCREQNETEASVGCISDSVMHHEPQLIPFLVGFGCISESYIAILNHL